MLQLPWMSGGGDSASGSSDGGDGGGGAAERHQRQRRRRQHQQRPASEDKRRQQQQQQHEQQQRSPLALSVVLATSLYCGAKAGIQAFQQLRRRNLRHLVRTVSPVLDDLGVTYWADFGTLLGMYREKDIIAYDNDADLVVLNPDWDALLAALRQRLRGTGSRACFVVPSEDRSIRWIRVVRGVGVMDLYGAFDGAAEPGSAAAEEAGEAAALAAAKQQQQHPDGKGQQQQQQQKQQPMVLIPQGHGDLCDVPSRLVFPLGRLRFKGVLVSVPGDVPGVLRHRYGDTFMVPRYMDKGRDCVEQGKFYARLLGALGRAGLRV